MITEYVKDVNGLQSWQEYRYGVVLSFTIPSKSFYFTERVRLDLAS